ncbi:carboxymuconolactone decarboxylase family protein [Streptomyces sp. NBC_00257]|uniref:carboxymuconolactone decarboxylase family protein n=1 Tax=unclassified Streptomyces TaxID=2593676 RepID=UPI00225BD1AC|nr:MULTISPECIES: carboxymuconolactone decarboxylase family protein [unclassified Streptomyces]WTB58698.1 carboxymuconolactone decarboxylase family protein [Streptomyces sp. NBC_00826]WTH88425.1 carboxymuconolactone decarboxylase family protein [Streptomyces sp. NBC_00825]WTH97154.1 carboxymuconolactone decarboxylase family protein [Streptomyces sp. NBC_00822]MCX4862652.1 carboxymuconolactone decarboxylase family protein [Streptomyces sp. NBC_00906]MCX4893889.1 carboxymuconolactone decarboxylas
MSEKESAAQQAIGDITPKLADLTDQVLFGDVWEREGLSPRDRSLVTVAALIALYRSEQLGFHLELALENGLTRTELSEAITHLAFYTGWPNAMGAAAQLKALLDAAQD